MTPTSLIIVADRGGLKAYRVNDTPNRGASLQLVQAFDITDAHGRYDEKLTDQAGRFPVSDGNGRHANAIAERTALETENERRICKQLAEHIAEVVKREGCRRLVLRRAGVDPCHDYGVAAGTDPRSRRRAREIRSRKNGAVEIVDALSIASAALICAIVGCNYP